MMRNACLVLGNSGYPEAVAYLVRALQDPAPLVRQHAAWGLGRISTAAARDALNNHLETEQESETRAEVLEALGL